MFENGIARKIVADIPDWLGNANRICRNTTWKTVVLMIPENRCSFNDPDLDFRGYNPYVRHSKLKVMVSKAPQDCILQVRCWLLNCLDYGNKPATLVQKCSVVCHILQKAEEYSGAHCFADINADNIIRAINDLWKNNYTYRIFAFRNIIPFIDFVNDEMDTTVPVDVRKLSDELQFLVDMLSGFGEHKHSPVLNDEYADQFVEGLDEIMRDETKTFNERSTAGMALLDTQLGLRLSEIPALESDCIHEKICNDGKTRPYIIYNCIKKARGEVNIVKIKTICTPLAQETVNYLLNLRKEAGDGIENSKFLYVLQDSRSREGKVADIGKFSRLFQELCAKYLTHLVDRQHCGIKAVHVHKKQFWIPAMHSFRSTFADRLYRMGFNIDYINCIMSHTHKESDACNNAYIPSIRKISTVEVDNAFSDMMESKLYN